MASATFNFDVSNGVEQASATLNALSGEYARVRFTERRASTNVFLEITASGVTSRVAVDQPRGWASGALAAGDSVRLIVQFSGSDAGTTCSGVLETAS